MADSPVGNRPELDDKRISRDEAAIRTASIWALRSTCLRKRVGAVILSEKGRVLSTGYAGAPRGKPHCLDAGCLIDPIHGGCTRTQHAEWNAIVDAKDRSVKLTGSTMYCTLSPCQTCAQMIRNAGISTVVYYHAYRDPAGIDILNANGLISVFKFSDLYDIILPDLELIK